MLCQERCPVAPLHFSFAWFLLEREANVWSLNDSDRQLDQIQRWAEYLQTATPDSLDNDEDADNDEDDEHLPPFPQELALFLERIFVRRKLDPGGDKVFSLVHAAIEQALDRPCAIQWSNDLRGLVIDPDYA